MLNFQHCGWPPDQHRIASYLRYEQLFTGAHARAFEQMSARVPGGRKRIIYLAVNLPGLVSKVVSDFLFGEAPLVRVGEQGSDVQAAYDAFASANKMKALLYEAGLSASFRGDAVFRARIAPNGPDGREHAVLESIPAYSYFAEHDPDNCRVVLSESIAWVRRMGRNAYLRVETHVPGTIYQTAYRLDEGEGKVGSQVSLQTLYEDGQAPPEEQETSVPESLLTHIPNFRTDSSYYGLSDYEDLQSLFDAVNNRLSKIDAILDKHAQPKLVGVPGLADQRGAVDASRLEYIEADSEIYKYLPRYVTWDGQLDAAFRELEQLLQLIAAVAEIAPSTFGLTSGDKATAESGKALRLRYVSTEHKCNRKKLYFDGGLKRAIRVAMNLSAARLGTPALTADPEVTWQDGLPQLYDEAVATESLRVSAGLSSRSSSIQRIDSVTAAQAAAELQRITEERQSSAAELGLDAFMNGGDVNQAAQEPQQP